MFVSHCMTFILSQPRNLTDHSMLYSKCSKCFWQKLTWCWRWSARWISLHHCGHSGVELFILRREIPQTASWSISLQHRIQMNGAFMVSLTCFCRVVLKVKVDGFDITSLLVAEMMDFWLIQKGERGVRMGGAKVLVHIGLWTAYAHPPVTQSNTA